MMRSVGTTVHALFVDPLGPYPHLDVDCWDEMRDATTFAEKGPVVLHPPCGRWCAMARLDSKLTHITPPAFAADLVKLAQWSQ